MLSVQTKCNFTGSACNGVRRSAVVALNGAILFFDEHCAPIKGLRGNQGHSLAVKHVEKGVRATSTARRATHSAQEPLKVETGQVADAHERQPLTARLRDGFRRATRQDEGAGPRRPTCSHCGARARRKRNALNAPGCDQPWQNAPNDTVVETHFVRHLARGSACSRRSSKRHRSQRLALVAFWLGIDCIPHTPCGPENTTEMFAKLWFAQIPVCGHGVLLRQHFFALISAQPLHRLCVTYPLIIDVILLWSLQLSSLLQNRSKSKLLTCHADCDSGSASWRLCLPGPALACHVVDAPLTAWPNALQIATLSLFFEGSGSITVCVPCSDVRQRRSV